MKKPYKFTELSDKTCATCPKKLKKNVVERKPTAEHCYKCSQIIRDNKQAESYKKYLANTSNKSDTE